MNSGNTYPLPSRPIDNSYLQKERISTESNNAKADEALNSVKRSIADFSRLSQILRLSGAVLVVSAMSLFLLKGWDNSNDISKFYLMLAQALMLGGAGIALSYLLKENKGARVFFGLSLVAIPVNFAVLGAFLFSQFNLMEMFNTTTIGDYPEFALWQAQDPVSVIIAVFSGLLTLVPIALFAFAVFERKHARHLTILLIVSSAFLLMPLREPLFVFSIAIANMFLLWKFIPRSDVTLTIEAKIARLITLIPTGIMIGRTAVFYDLDAASGLIASSALFYLFRHLRLRLVKNDNINNLMDFVSFVSAPFIGGLSLLVLTSWIRLPDSVLPFLFATVTSLLILDVVRREVPAVAKKLYTLAGSMIFAIANIIGFAFFDATALTLLSALMIGYCGVKHKSVCMLIASFTILVCPILQLIPSFFEIFHFNKWALMAIAGFSIIVIASLLEKFGATIKLKISNSRYRLKESYSF